MGEALLTADEPEEALLHARAVLSVEPDNTDGLDLAHRAAEANGDDEIAGGYRRMHTALSESSAGGPEPATQTGPEDRLEQRPLMTLDDVGGIEDVKRELRRSFLAPMKDPQLRAHYGAELGGGLLLFGPPGCGKTMLARAVAGELGAQFISLGLHDVLDMWLGESERQLHATFEEARRRAPCVLFFDEIDALGQKRGQLKGQAGRNIVNQLLSEMDGLDSGVGDDVFVLAATNHPWDVDSAFRRPGRFDRSLLVLPPDRQARVAILEVHLRERPTEGLELDQLAARSEGYSGADLALVCRTAAAHVMAEASEAGVPRPIVQSDLRLALEETTPSTRPWFELAHNYAAFANEGGAYDDLLTYIRKRKLA